MDSGAGSSRFQVLDRLSHGGMGVVYRVRDAVTGQELALKRPHEAATSKPRASLMLELEYHLLSRLSHPGIVQVREFGVDGEGPFLAMELLDGCDVRELAPLPPLEACRHLRDVASALALLHSRRLVHRDVSPRNVRVTSEGQAKLLDFGSTTAFGTTESRAGTPPCMAPECVFGQQQDHRTDLYSLGALAYFLLTGRHAYPARSVAEVQEAWALPPPAPSQLAVAGPEEFPAALDNLVMSLLHRDPLARPASAAEVIDRLEALSGLAPERGEPTVQSYLRGVPLLGRDKEMERLRARLRATRRGRGSSILIESSPGAGASRLLSEIAIEGQIAGALVLQADAALCREPYALARSLLLQLLRTAPVESHAVAAQNAELLCHALPELPGIVGREVTPVAAGELPGERRLRVHEAMLDLLLTVARSRTLLIAVDNLDAVDESSLAWLAAIARKARAASVLLVATKQPRAQARDTATMRALLSIGDVIRPAPLSQDHVTELLRSLFGSAQHLPRLAERLYASSGGNPRDCIELVQHLVAQGAIRFVDGAWALPQDVPARMISGGFDAVLSSRVEALSHHARTLAEALSLVDGTIPLELCQELALERAGDRVFVALDELVGAEILAGSQDGYRFGHAAIASVLAGRLTDEARRSAHERIGDWLLAQRGDEPKARIAAAFHLLEAGRPGAEDMLAEAGLGLAHGSDAMAEAAPALEAALKRYREQKRGILALVSLLGPLTAAGYYVDRRLSARYGDETVSLLRRATGLRLADRLRPFMGKRLSTLFGLATAALRHVLSGRPLGLSARGSRALGFADLVAMLLDSVGAQVAVAALTLDPWKTDELVRSIEPLTALGKRSPAYAIYEFCRQARRSVQDQTPRAVRGMLRLHRDVQAGHYRFLPESSRELLSNGALYAAGALKCLRDESDAPRYAQMLEASGSPLYKMVADQLRMVYHAYRGELSQAEAQREKVELHAIQAGSAWQVEVWSPCMLCHVHTTTGDVIGLKRAIEQLEQVASDVPSLKRYLLFAQAAYRLLRGEYQPSVDLSLQALDGVAPRSFIGWTAAMATLAAAYNAQGRYTRAREVAEEAVSLMKDEDRAFTAVNLRIQLELCVAEDAIGERERAVERLERLLAEHGPNNGPITLGLLHEARAQLALRARDAETFRMHATAMGRWFRPTKHPALIARCEQLEVRAVQAGLFDPSRRPRRTNPSAALLANAEVTRSILRTCKSAEERAERALSLLIERCEAVSGYLYLSSGGKMMLVAPRHGEEPPPRVEDAVEAAAGRFTEEAETTVHEHSASLPAPRPRRTAGDDRPEADFTPLVLGTSVSGTFQVVGIAALMHPGTPLTVPNYDMLEAIARTLYEAGDMSV